jgi:hypothetical protein
MIERLRDVIGAVSFHRGLALGALVGSAIAGSTIWARVRDARRPTEPPVQELEPAAGQPDASATAPGTSGTATTSD